MHRTYVCPQLAIGRDGEGTLLLTQISSELRLVKKIELALLNQFIDRFSLNSRRQKISSHALCNFELYDDYRLIQLN